MTENFKAYEFECKCCGANRMNASVVRRLQELRTKYGYPMQIASGFRCSKHNAEIEGNPESSHILGYAVDIAISSSSQRYNFLLTALEFFDRIGVAGNFIHLDLDPHKIAKVIWTY